MRILILGDLHGKLPANLSEEIIRKSDLVISNGDVCSIPEELRILDYEARKQGKDVENVVETEKMIEYNKKAIETGRRILEYLDKFNKPILIIPGNSDRYYDEEFTWIKKELRINWYKKLIGNLTNIKDVHLNYYKFNDFTFVGLGLFYVGEQIMEIDNRYSRDSYKYFRKLLNKFDEVVSNIKNDNLVFIYHLPPKGFFDLVLYPKSYRFKEHVGSEKELEFILKYKPKLVITGHMHEFKGYIWINNETLILHPGYRSYVLIEIKNSKIEILDFP